MRIAVPIRNYIKRGAFLPFAAYANLYLARAATTRMKVSLPTFAENFSRFFLSLALINVDIPVILTIEVAEINIFCFILSSAVTLQLCRYCP